MKIIEKSVVLEDSTVSVLSSKLFNRFFKGEKIAVFDIETTGLSPKYNNIILAGFVIIDTSNFSGKLIQYFADNPIEERDVLGKAIETLKDIDFVITYNGKSFDMPFLYERSSRLSLPYEQIYNLDLYQLVKNHSTLKETLGSLSQKSMEKFMGIASNRDDEISGGESVTLYTKYTNSLEKNLLTQILLHNSDDVLQLTRLIPLIKYFDMDIAIKKLGFPLGEIYVTGFECGISNFIVKGMQRRNLKDYISFPSVDFLGKFEFLKEEGTWYIEYPVYTRKEGKYLDISTFEPANKLRSEINNPSSCVNGKLIIQENGIDNHMAQYDFALALAEEVKKRVK